VLYELKYASPKTAESTILYHLKRNGITRRDKAEHIRKVTPKMVDEWVGRYEEGQSLAQIATNQVTAATVLNHLRMRGVQLRDKVEAQIKAVTKYVKKPFDGDGRNRAYLVGFARGDLNVSRHGRAIRVKTATTHPLMVDLIRKLFGPYSFVRVSPRLSGLAGYEWSVQADLDASFSFLLEFRRKVPDWVFEKEVFRYFIGGFFDAEGSIWLNQTAIHGFALSITNRDAELLERIQSRLREEGFNLYMRKQRDGDVWKIETWRREEVYKLIRFLWLRHEEKVSKGRVALRIESIRTPDEYDKLVNDWDSLLAEIRRNRDAYVQLAKEKLAEQAQK
jgi:hypothetical protein